MDSTTRRVLVACGVIALVACLCLSLLSIALATFTLRSAPIDETSHVESLTIETQALEPPLPLEQTASPDIPESTQDLATSTPPLAEIPPEIAREMDRIQEQVVAIRGLPSNSPVARLLLTPGQLRQLVMDDFLKDYSSEEAREDAIVLAAFGLLDPDYDLYNLFIELYSEQVAGFYDPETKEMYVIQGENFGGPQKLTYAHEYVHSLQDQHFDIEQGLGYNDESCEEDTERCAAIQALLEGDASMVELQWFSTSASRQDIAEIQRFYRNYESPVFDSAPAFLQEDFLFPYIKGYAFVEYLYNLNGWDAVNQAYLNPPVSTSQILHPESYPDNVPLPVELPDSTSVLGEGWQELDRGVMGEWYTYLILAHGSDPNARLDVSQAQRATNGWKGDSYVVYHNPADDSIAMVLQTIWADENQAALFGDAFQQYATSRFGAPENNIPGLLIWDNVEGYTTLRVQGAVTTWTHTPDSIYWEIIWSHLQ